MEWASLISGDSSQTQMFKEQLNGQKSMGKIKAQEQG